MAGALLMSGCGGTSKPQTSPAAQSGTKAASASMARRFPDPAEREIAGLAETYMHAMARGDYEAACATRSADEQVTFAREAGSCPRLLAVVIKAKGGKALARLFITAKAGTVVIRGRRAAVSMVQPGQVRPFGVLVAKREASAWRLVDTPDADAKRLLGR